MQLSSQRGRADLPATFHSMEQYSSWRTCLNSTSSVLAVETSYIRFIPTSQSLCTENSNTDNRQDDDGTVTASFGLGDLDMQLGLVYWVRLGQHPFVVSETLLQRQDVIWVANLE